MLPLACRSMVQTAEARRLTAFHEAGHALVALNTPGATPIHKATIVPRGHALGMVSLVPHQDEHSVTRRQMRAGIDVSMGGRVAEELVFGDDHVSPTLSLHTEPSQPRRQLNSSSLLMSAHRMHQLVVMHPDMKLYVRLLTQAVWGR